MATSCEPEDLEYAVRCWCLSDTQLDQLFIYLLVAWANGEAPT